MKSFIEVLGKDKTSKAQEVALSHRMELETEIAALEAAIPSMEKQEKIHSQKMEREAAGAFEKVLGDLKNPSTESIIEKYLVVKAVENGENNPFTQKLADARERLTVLKEVLALFPENLDDIKIED